MFIPLDKNAHPYAKAVAGSSSGVLYTATGDKTITPPTGAKVMAVQVTDTAYLSVGAVTFPGVPVVDTNPFSWSLVPPGGYCFFVVTAGQQYTVHLTGTEGHVVFY